jgi:putative ABC transport system permease protein
MSSPRWHKVLADLKLSRSRTLLVILSIAIGVFAVGTMLTAQTALQEGVDQSFDDANAASAVLMTEPFGEELVAATQNLPEIDDAQGRAVLQVRLQIDGDAARNLDITALATFDDIRVDRFMPEAGAWPPATGELLLERTSRADIGVAIGDEVVVETPDGVQHTLLVGGTTYDPGVVSPWLAGDRLSGYATLDTLAQLGQPVAFNQLHVVAADDPRSLEQGERVAGLTRDEVLEPAGVAVQRIAVQDTPRYHSAALSDALMVIFGLLGGLILLLGVFLVVNTVSALLAQQVRQIGIMKAIGGQRRQIVALYLAIVLGYGVLAVAIAVPLAALGGWRFASFFGDILNLELQGSWFPPQVIAIEVALGLLVPVLAALVPILRGTRITVREAITSYGLSQRPYQGSFIDRVLGRLRGFPRPVLLSLRNTFRRRGRLALTLATLTLGGALFASVTSIQSSLDRTLEDVMQYSAYDVELNLSQAEPVTAAIAEAERLPGVDYAEGWIATNASRIRPDGMQNSNIWLMAAPPETDLIRPTLTEGRWLQPGEEALVVNVDFQRDEADIGVGDLATLRVEGHEVSWPVVGIVSSQLMGPVAYAPYEPFSEAVGMAGEVNRILLVTEEGTEAAQEAAAQAADELLRGAGLPVVQVATQAELRSGTESAFDIIVILLLIVGGLLVLVGSLGLMGAMSLNVLERTREIGMMRAIGASNGMVARIVIVEGLVIGVLSWFLGALLSIPLSWGLGSAIGIAFVQAPLAYAFSAAGVVLWLVLVVVLSVIASLWPARSAWRLSVRESLAYE